MVQLDDIQAARERIAGALKLTPCVESELLSERCGVSLYLKHETLQRTGSFKPRGALNKVLGLEPDRRRQGVVAASAGNHAQGVAWAAAREGVTAHIVMPEATPLVKVSRTQALGARVELHGENLDEALERARELEATRGFTLIHPFDDPQVIAGQGTIGLELLEQVPGLEVVVCPIGGGGLISGVATAVKALRPEIAVYGVQSRSAPAMKHSFDRGEWTAAEVGATIAEGITLKRPGRITFPIIRERVDGIELVSEGEIENGIFELLEAARTLTEGAGAAGYCALRQGRFPQLVGKTVAVVLCGANIDLNILGRIIERSLVRQHRLVQLRITIKDRPGGLAGLLDRVARSQANVLHLHHDRTFTETAFWQVEVDLTLETRDREHIERLIEDLRAEGYKEVEEVKNQPLPGAPPGP